MQPKYSAIALLVAISAMEAPTVSAQTCVPPPGFVDTPPPEIARVEELVSHTQEVTIERSIAFLRDLSSRTPLAQGIDRTSGLPGVTGTYRLNEGPFQPGARRLVCLTDGSTAVEQVLLQEQAPDKDRFRYVVWNYTSPTFPPLNYAIGEIVRTAIGDTRTHVRWTFSFQLDRTRYPAHRGGFGDFEGFLERHAERMRKSLAGGKKRAEELPPSAGPSEQPGETATASEAGTRAR